MSGPITIDDPSDPRLADYLGLTDMARRSRHEPAAGIYLAEGEKIIRRALAAGHRPRSMLLSSRWLQPLASMVAAVQRSGGAVYVGEASVIEAVTGFHVHRGALASLHRPPAHELGTVLQAALHPPHLTDLDRSPDAPVRPRIAVFEDLADTTNLGAAFRSCAALGVGAVLLSPRCADPLYRRAVRVSMGTVLQLPWVRLSRWPDDLSTVRSAGFTPVALALREQSWGLRQLARDLPGPLALVFGTEGEGLSEAAIEACDVVCRIPMAGPVDSLNVAAAAAVACHATQ